MTDPTEFDGDRYTQDDNLNVRGTLRVKGVPVTSTGGMFASASPVVDSHLVAYLGTDGALTQTSGIAVADIGDVKAPAAASQNNIAIFGATENQLEDGGIPISGIGTVNTVVSAVTNNAIVTYSGTDGKSIKDSQPGVATLDNNGDLVTPASVASKFWSVTDFGKLDQIASSNVSDPISGRKIFSNTTNSDNLTIRRPDGTDIDVEAAAGGSGGLDGQVQFNDSGFFGAQSGFSFAKATNNLTLAGNVEGATLTISGVLAVPESRNIIAGDGLFSGGSLASDVTLNITAADGSISVTADAIAVGTLQGDAQHGSLLGGNNHSSATTGTAGFMSAADKTKLDAVAAGAENNTASNVGVGTGIFKQKSGSNLEFKSLTSGNGLQFIGNTDEVEINLPTSAGANRVLASNAGNTAYESSNLVSFSNGTCWFVNDLTLLGTESLALGFFTNNSSSDTLGSTMLGNNCCNKLGKGNNNITIVGTQGLNTASADGALANTTGIGQNIFNGLSSGNNATAIGRQACQSVAEVIDSVIFGGLNIGNSTTSLRDCGIYGASVLAPAGDVLDYVNFHNLIQMNTDSESVVIGGTQNLKPDNADWSLNLASATQVLNLNILANVAAESALTANANGDLWFNTALNTLRTARGGVAQSVMPAQLNFDNSNLLFGILIIDHDRGQEFNSVTIYDENDNITWPDEISPASANQLIINMNSFGTIAGTWTLVVG